MITIFPFIQILNTVRATKYGMIADKDRQLSELESTITDLISQREAALVERDALLQVLYIVITKCTHSCTLVLYMRCLTL